MKAVVKKLGGAFARAEIKFIVSAEELRIEMPMKEFIQALAARVSPAFIVTKGGLGRALDTAAEDIERAMKAGTGASPSTPE